jgi:hypothetical protein
LTDERVFSRVSRSSTTLYCAGGLSSIFSPKFVFDLQEENAYKNKRREKEKGEAKYARIFDIGRAARRHGR